MSLTWHIWKARCSQIFQGKTSCPQTTINATAVQIQQSTIFQTRSSATKPPLIQASFPPTIDVIAHECWVDGSFKAAEDGGIAFVLKNQGCLIKYEVMYFANAASSFQMEAEALLMALESVRIMNIDTCILRTDSEILERTFMGKNLLNNLYAADWRAYSTLVKIANILDSNKSYHCVFIPREENHEATNWQIGHETFGSHIQDILIPYSRLGEGKWIRWRPSTKSSSNRVLSGFFFLFYMYP